MDMVEQVARQIARLVPTESGQWNPGYGEDFPRDYSKAEQNLIRDIARAAIEAMREPTQAMKSAGFLASPHDAGGCRDQFPSNKDWMEEAVISPYEAMIDAALKKA